MTKDQEPTENKDKTIELLRSKCASQDQEILALKAQVNAQDRALASAESYLDIDINRLHRDTQGAAEMVMREVQEARSKSPAQCLDEFEAKVRAEAFDEAAKMCDDFPTRRHCHDSAHDDRWCAHCESMEIGVDAMASALREKSKEAK